MSNVSSARTLAAPVVGRRFTEEEERFIVTQLACYVPPAHVQLALWEQFGILATREQVRWYDPLYNFVNSKHADPDKQRMADCLRQSRSWQLQDMLDRADDPRVMMVLLNEGGREQARRQRVEQQENVSRETFASLDSTPLPTLQQMFARAREGGGNTQAIESGSTRRKPKLCRSAKRKQQTTKKATRTRQAARLVRVPGSPLCGSRPMLHCSRMARRGRGLGLDRRGRLAHATRPAFDVAVLAP